MDMGEEMTRVPEHIPKAAILKVFAGALGLRETFQGIPRKLLLIIINRILKKAPKEMSIKRLIYVSTKLKNYKEIGAGLF